jgi:hypothetical protein
LAAILRHEGVINSCSRVPLAARDLGALRAQNFIQAIHAFEKRLQKSACYDMRFSMMRRFLRIRTPDSWSAFEGHISDRSAYYIT